MAKTSLYAHFHECPTTPLNWASAMLECLANAYEDNSLNSKYPNTELTSMSGKMLCDALFGIQSLINAAAIMMEEKRNGEHE
ncbi:hypothetical protein GCM10007897_14890 [Sphingobium jiangsuense]|uniref:DUF3077 domain-containing protein n=1 Tax=Sphingobium jiangsuense TaxID=870476 RepID=A0A7W6BHN5_9SPHN|nr:hypothetical protein [Sphingobium jiangsuense]MBB3925067.1 hypothetical protein [Sphingobium jiangsuense]GLT00105.1 hypothetical protein GCM10007897_14890 [Sphingobium jiangsuense]